MAGVLEQIEASAPSRARRAALVAVGALVLALILLGGRSAAPPAAVAQGTCPPLPVGLSPEGPGPTRFTMLIRINQQVNVDTWTNFNESRGGLGGRVRPQDIFVINTRFQNGSGGTTPAVAEGLANELRGTFPCNRIVALNGMGYDPAAPGYAFSLITNPNVFALMTDFEEADWEAGRTTDPARPLWTDNFRKAFPIVKGWNASMAATAASNPASAGKRTGLVPQDNSKWNFRQVAQDLDKKNSRLGGPHLGPLSVQTQDSCANGPAAFGARAKQLRLQYKFKTIIKKVKVPGKKKKRKIKIRRKLKPEGRPSRSNLSLQISFSDTPTASASMAILRTSAATAAACVPKGLKQGGGAFFFFASDDSMRLLFQQPQIAPLRPPAVSSSKGGTGGVTPGGT
jgi:hypothetical protein